MTAMVARGTTNLGESSRQGTEWACLDNHWVDLGH